MITRSDAAPPLPGPAQIKAFERRFEPDFLLKLENRLRTTSTSHVGAAAMVKQLKAKATADLPLGTKIAKNILSIGDTFLLEMFSGLLFAGLDEWCPDIMSPPDTLYNRAHQIIFLQTFNSVAVGYGYRFLAPTSAGVNNHAMVTQVYQSFLFSYMREKAKLEKVSPGKLEQNKDDNNSIRRRARLTAKRVEFALGDKLPNRVIALFGKPYCNSDDESGSDGEGHSGQVVNAKSQRSASTSDFVQKLDKRRIAFARAQKGKKRTNLQERPRFRVAEPAESDISYHIPKFAPIDYFDPEFFNNLPAETRFKYSNNGIALPLLKFHDAKDWKTMGKADFMAKYGNEVLKQYNIPTEEEMEGQGNDGWDEPEAEPDDDDDAEVDGLMQTD
ncbi:hypothetical protein B0H12DRAFT_1236243 [Mycena haematopus]|nr:hypothetical protein B0H12DRAFT_1236243 [Mycena haematopus]